MTISWKRFITLMAVTLTASFCVVSAYADDDDDGNNIHISAQGGFINVAHLPFDVQGVNNIRFAALQEAANSLGARGGLAWQSRNIDLYLEHEAVFLDQAFDFNQLLLNHNVLPPVLAQDNESMNVDNGETLRIAEKSYRILQPAHFVTAPPNWRNYLWMSYQQPSLSDRSLLPTSKAESAIWDHFFKKGWKEGVSQANQIFTENLDRLKRDMTGMILYRQLLSEHMVSAPFVAKMQLGVTGDASQVRINDEIMRITAQSQLQPNPKQWKPILAK